MKVLWVGDAVIQTGFARVTHSIVERLIPKGWDVQVLGVNFTGDPPTHRQWKPYPYPIWPAAPGGDHLGIGRIAGICREFQPDVVMLLNDPWLVALYQPEIPQGIPVVAYMPIDAPNQATAKNLTVNRAITYTNFGKKELRLGGYQGPIDVIPHGVDLDIYNPVSREEARSHLKVRGEIDVQNMFIVGNVNRNQPRKRLDLTIQYWTQWWVKAGQPRDAFLYLHCSNVDHEGHNVLQLADYYGIGRQIIITNKNMSVRNCMFEKDLKMVYSMFDLQLSTTLGEGWGLTTHEGMACRVAQAVPRYSGLGEWADGAVHFIDIGGYQATPRQINTIGGVPDMQSTVDAIDKFYRDKDYRQHMAELAFKRATEPQFNWDTIARQFDQILNEVVSERRGSGPIGIVR